ncbi:MAG: AAA family ATPase [Bacteroidota bacterium]
MGQKKIYVAATSQHVGKTTSTLGLLSAIRERGLNVGYCKPVGQQFIDIGPSRADKDALLFASSMDFELVPELHSPVILGAGATTSFLDDPEHYPFRNRLLKASKILERDHDVVVYEGTGHPGVGSVVNLSNATVAKLLGAGVIMVVEAGIGNTIDRLTLNLALFQQVDVPIIGVIINKARREKIDKIRHYVEPFLTNKGIRLLGILPYEEELGLPVMATICSAVNGRPLLHEDKLDNRVSEIIAGSLVDMEQIKRTNNQLLVVSHNRLGEAIKKLVNVATFMNLEESPLSGIIVTGKGDISPENQKYIDAFQLPVLQAQIDTYESVIKISQIEVKINTRTPWKVKKAIDLFREHVDVSCILDNC